MAIDKSRTSPAMKVGVIILVVAFTLGIGGTFSYVLLAPPTSTQSADASSTANTKLEQLGTQYTAAIDSLKQQLQTKPKDYDTLKALGDQYYDWALGVKQASPNSGIDTALWPQSADYYKQALSVKPGDPSVQTDLSIAQYYSGETSAAIATVESVRKANPKFTPALFNAGIFYGSAGDVAKATAAFNEYLKLDPNGDNAATAKDMLQQLKTSSAQPSSTTTGQ